MTIAFSDEPTRVRQITTSLFADQQGPIHNDVQGASTTVVLGADGRDDAAIVGMSGQFDLVLASDYVRGTTFTLFELGLLSLYDVGYYLVAANLSDIAAMGAAPIGVLTVVRYPKDLADDQFTELMTGIKDACHNAKTQNLGGDIGGAERVIVSASALGMVEHDRALRRSGAKPGDLLYVTGPVGAAGAAVIYFSSKDQKDWTIAADLEEEMLRYWRRPQALITEGRLLTKYALATSCQDTSDGLRATIEQLAGASGVGFQVYGDQVPVPASVQAVAELAGVDRLALALSASVDFQLAFTIPAEKRETLLSVFAANNLNQPTLIGEAVAEPCVRLAGADADGLPGVAWRHQSGSVGDAITSELKHK